MRCATCRRLKRTSASARAAPLPVVLRGIVPFRTRPQIYMVWLGIGAEFNRRLLPLVNALELTSYRIPVWMDQTPLIDVNIVVYVVTGVKNVDSFDVQDPIHQQFNLHGQDRWSKGYQEDLPPRLRS